MQGEGHDEHSTGSGPAAETVGHHPAPPEPDSHAAQSGLRGTHIAWVRLERPAQDATVEMPLADLEPAPSQGTWTLPVASEPAPRPQPLPIRPAPMPAALEAEGPSALGRLVAVVITAGLAWALTLAVVIWLIVVLVS